MSYRHDMGSAELKRGLRTALEDAMLAGVGLYEQSHLTNKIGAIEEELRNRVGGNDIIEAEHARISNLGDDGIRESRSPLLKALTALGYRFEEGDSTEDRAAQAAIVRALAGAAMEIQDPKLQSECSTWLENHGDVNRSTERPSG